MEAIVNLLSAPQFAAEVELMRQGGALYIWGYPMLRFLSTHKQHRRFLTPVYLRKTLWHMTKLFLKRYTPAAVGNFYLKLAGYRATARAIEGTPP
jgi:hypothetical protein